MVPLSEAAELVGINPSSIRRCYYRGDLPSTVKAKNKLWFDVDELKQLPSYRLKAVQPEVPDAGPRLVPSPASVLALAGVGWCLRGC